MPKAGTSDLYVCPSCQAPLTEHADRLVCTASPEHRFPIVDGLPRFVSDEGYAGSFGLQWKAFSRTQVDEATGAPLTRERFFRGTGWPERMEGERILEAGCGSGRFTEVLLSTGAEVVSFDYSGAAEVTHKSFADRGARVCQASIYEMPYPPASFDRVFCYGVIQHTPDVRGAFRALVRMVKPGGHLAVDVYDARRVPFTARYRVRWLTRRMDKDRLLRWCRAIVPAYMKVAPPLHPWNQLLFPIRDYRGKIPGFTREQEIEMSVLDTFDMLAPEFDTPQSLRTMQAWCREEALVDVRVRRGGNGIEVTARRAA